MVFRVCLLVSMLVTSSVQAEGCHITPAWEAMDKADIKLEKAGEVLNLPVRLANTPVERAAGYQWICAEDGLNTAVLFEFPQLVISSFHMRNVYMPLDIYFFDEAGTQVNAMVMRPEPPDHNLKPIYYQPHAAFRYALEMARPADHDLRSVPTPMRLLVDSL